MNTLLYCKGMETWVKGCNVCIPGKFASLISTAYTAILIAVPLIIIITGMFSLASSIMKQKEEDIKKAQQMLIKKLITGAIVFFLFALVKWLITYFDGGLINCFDGLINYNSSSEDNDYVCGDESNEAGCGDNSSNANMDFGETNSKCILAETDGATRIPDGRGGYKYVCYKRDDTCCCENGVPFKYTETNSNQKSGCMCAISQTAIAGGGYYVEAIDGEACHN